MPGMKTYRSPSALFLMIAMVCLCGCAIVQNIHPVSSHHRIDKIYIVENHAVLMNAFLPELQKQVEALGIKTEIVQPGQKLPSGAYTLEYTANWNWTVAETLVYFNARVKYKEEVIGSVTYDCRGGVASPDKFGHTADKIHPLLRKLLGSAVPHSWW